MKATRNSSLVARMDSAHQPSMDPPPKATAQAMLALVYPSPPRYDDETHAITFVKPEEVPQIPWLGITENKKDEVRVLTRRPPFGSSRKVELANVILVKTALPEPPHADAAAVMCPFEAIEPQIILVVETPSSSNRPNNAFLRLTQCERKAEKSYLEAMKQSRKTPLLKLAEFAKMPQFKRVYSSIHEHDPYYRAYLVGNAQYYPLNVLKDALPLRMYVLKDKNGPFVLAVSHILTSKKDNTVFKFDPRHVAVYVTVVTSEPETDSFADPELMQEVEVAGATDGAPSSKGKEARKKKKTKKDKEKELVQTYACVHFFTPGKSHVPHLLVPMQLEEIPQLVQFLSDAFPMSKDLFCITPGAQPTSAECAQIAATKRRFDDLAAEYWGAETPEASAALETQSWTAYFERVNGLTEAYVHQQENLQIATELGIDPWIGDKLRLPVYEQFSHLDGSSGWCNILQVMLEMYDAKFGRSLPELSAYYRQLSETLPWFHKADELLQLTNKHGQQHITYKRRRQNQRIYDALKLKQKFKSAQQDALLDACDLALHRWLPLNEAMLAAAAAELKEDEPAWMETARQLHVLWSMNGQDPLVLKTITGKQTNQCGDNDQSWDDDDDDESLYSMGYGEEEEDSAEFEEDKFYKDDDVELLQLRLRTLKRKLEEPTEDASESANKKQRGLEDIEAVVVEQTQPSL